MPDGRPCGDIQTKLFSNPYARDFHPNQELPEYPGSNTIDIGECGHCHKLIRAIIVVNRDLEREKMIAEWRQNHKHDRTKPKWIYDNGTRVILDHYE